MKKNPELPEELITTEILPKLPAKSLIRFKCVSKNWLSIISSAHFAQAQLQAQMGPHSSSSSLSRCVITKKSYFSILDYGKCDDEVVDFDGPYDQYVNFYESDDFHIHNGEGVHSLIGSCNGLVCIGWTEYSPDYMYYYVYNPCTADYLEIEDATDLEGDSMIFGFGYVSSVDDYKIIVISLSRDCPWFCIHVYSLKSKKWKKLPDVKELAFASEHDEGGCPVGVLVNEILHWDMIVRLDDGLRNDCIGGFDLVEEEFNTMPMPLPLTKLGDSRGDHCGFRLCVLDECLCAWGCFADGGVEMWMMKEYGVSDSWTKLFNLNLRQETGDLCADFFGFTKAGKVLIRTDDEELLFADLSYDPPKYVSLAHVDDAVNYVASLISPSGITSQEES